MNQRRVWKAKCTKNVEKPNDVTGISGTRVAKWVADMGRQPVNMATVPGKLMAAHQADECSEEKQGMPGLAQKNMKSWCSRNNAEWKMKRFARFQFWSSWGNWSTCTERERGSVWHNDLIHCIKICCNMCIHAIIHLYISIDTKILHI